MWQRHDKYEVSQSEISLEYNMSVDSPAFCQATFRFSWTGTQFWLIDRLHTLRLVKFGSAP